ncbi:MAG: hypothetical protein QW266_07780 [Sulfolobales archaeon]
MRRPIGRIVNRATIKTCCWNIVGMSSAVSVIDTLRYRLLSEPCAFMVKLTESTEVLELEISEVFKESRGLLKYSSEAGVHQ